MTGGFVCTLVFGYLVRSTGGYRAPLCVIAAMVMASAILFAFINPSRPVWKEENVLPLSDSVVCGEPT
jgi:sugar phosphate permease